MHSNMKFQLCELRQELVTIINLQSTLCAGTALELSRRFSPVIFPTEL